MSPFWPFARARPPDKRHTARIPFVGIFIVTLSSPRALFVFILIAIATEVAILPSSFLNIREVFRLSFTGASRLQLPQHPRIREINDEKLAD
jgi:hypothetical protein